MPSLSGRIALARGESTPNLSVKGVKPFRSVPKTLSTPIKERSVLWTTPFPPVAKQIPPVANPFFSCGQPFVLASILGCVDAKTVVN